MKRVLGYLDDIQNYALHYNKYPEVLERYSDANCITGSTKKIHHWIRFIYWWKSNIFGIKKNVTRSIMEYEFIALDKSSKGS